MNVRIDTSVSSYQRNRFMNATATNICYVMVDLILVFTFMIGYLTYLLTCCNRLLQRHHSFQGWDRSSSTRPLVEDAQTIDLCMIERGYHVFRLAFSSFPVQCAYCTRRCIQLPNLRLPPALVLIVYLK